MPDDVLPAGPIFGPDFVTISLAYGRGTSFEVPIYPDANNAELKAGGLAVMFYFQPARVFLANRRNSDDLDFSMRAMVKRGGRRLLSPAHGVSVNRPRRWSKKQNDSYSEYSKGRSPWQGFFDMCPVQNLRRSEMIMDLLGRGG